VYPGSGFGKSRKCGEEDLGVLMPSNPERERAGLAGYRLGSSLGNLSFFNFILTKAYDITPNWLL
jgi:hypothetical protein